MKFNFVITKDGKYFNQTINLPEDGTIDGVLEDLQKASYDTIPTYGVDVFMFTDKDGLVKLNEWVIEKFCSLPVGMSWDTRIMKSGTSFHMQPFGKIHLIEV